MQIKQLDFKHVPDHCIIVCIGRRKAGKTQNVLDILYHKRNSFSHGIVFCGSKATIKEYEKVIPSTFIHDGFESSLLKQIVDKQERDVELDQARNIFIILDDLMYTKTSITKDPTVRRIAMNGRHARIFLILTMQYSMDLDPSIRQQIDFVFLSREKNPHYREKLYNAYNVCFRTFSEFDRVMQGCTQNYETFVMTSAGDTESDRPEDNVFWFKSKLGRNYRINKTGTWWKYHKEKFDKQYFLQGTGTGLPAINAVKKLCLNRTPDLTHTKEGIEHMAMQRRQHMGERKGSVGWGLKVREVDAGDEMVRYID